MVGHDDERVHVVRFSLAMKERVDDDLRDIGARERTGSSPRVERGFDSLAMNRVAFAQTRAGDFARRRVGGAERDELRNLGRVESRPSFEGTGFEGTCYEFKVFLARVNIPMRIMSS